MLFLFILRRLYYALELVRPPKIIFIMAITIANNAADQKPEVLKLVIMLSTNKIINTVMMKEHNPRVRMFKGRVNILKINPMVAFARAIRSAAIIALPNPSTCTPGVMYAPKSIAKPITNISTIKLIIMFNLV